MNKPPCFLCKPDPKLVFYRGTLVLGLYSENLPLLVTKRHRTQWIEASPDEQTELLTGVAKAHDEVLARGYEIEIREAPHLHVRIVPRPVPLPDRVIDRPFTTSFAPTVVTGESDPLLPYLKRHLDEAESADLLASFILESGVALLEGHLEDLLDRGGRVRILTGDYLGITEPNALLRLLDLQEGTKGALDARIFVSEGTSFHPKAYLFHGPGPIAYIGSSNLSRTALEDGVEWNYQIVFHTGFDAVARSFDRLFRDRRTRPLDTHWIEGYRRRRPERVPLPVDVTPEPPRSVPEPHSIQRQALEALVRTRAEGNAAGLVVLATGLGKTWLSAFDTVQFKANRILFVAHRDEILRQALATFRASDPRPRWACTPGMRKLRRQRSFLLRSRPWANPSIFGGSARAASTTSSSTSFTTHPPAATGASSTTSSPDSSLGSQRSNTLRISRDAQIRSFWIHAQFVI